MRQQLLTAGASVASLCILLFFFLVPGQSVAQLATNAITWSPDSTDRYNREYGRHLGIKDGYVFDFYNHDNPHCIQKRDKDFQMAQKFFFHSHVVRPYRMELGWFFEDQIYCLFADRSEGSTTLNWELLQIDPDSMALVKQTRIGSLEDINYDEHRLILSDTFYSRLRYRLAPDSSQFLIQVALAGLKDGRQRLYNIVGNVDGTIDWSDTVRMPWPSDVHEHRSTHLDYLGVVRQLHRTWESSGKKAMEHPSYSHQVVSWRGMFGQPQVHKIEVEGHRLSHLDMHLKTQGTWHFTGVYASHGNASPQGVLLAGVDAVTGITFFDSRLPVKFPNPGRKKDGKFDVNVVGSLIKRHNGGWYACFEVVETRSRDRVYLFQNQTPFEPELVTKGIHRDLIVLSTNRDLQIQSHMRVSKRQKTKRFNDQLSYSTRLVDDDLMVYLYHTKGGGKFHLRDFMFLDVIRFRSDGRLNKRRIPVDYAKQLINIDSMKPIGEDKMVFRSRFLKRTRFDDEPRLGWGVLRVDLP